MQTTLITEVEAVTVDKIYNGSLKVLENDLEASNIRLKSMQDDNKTLYCELFKIKKATFIARLKWLFTGVKSD